MAASRHSLCFVRRASLARRIGLAVTILAILLAPFQRGPAVAGETAFERALAAVVLCGGGALPGQEDGSAPQGGMACVLCVAACAIGAGETALPERAAPAVAARLLPGHETPFVQLARVLPEARGPPRSSV